jgi:hypothetical protein
VERRAYPSDGEGAFVAPYASLMTEDAPQLTGISVQLFTSGAIRLIDCQVRQKRRDFCAGHLIGMSFVVEENIKLNSSDIGFLRAHRVVREPDGIAHPVKPCLGAVFHG